MNAAEQVNSMIRDVPNFPKDGILFKDITTAIKDAKTLEVIIDWFVEVLKDKGVEYVVGLESRGFIFAPTIAYKLKAGFVPIRKKGKLPAATEKAEYALEYGTDVIEIHKDAFEQGAKVAIVDDLLATGGTAAAACELVKRLGGEIVSIAFLIELKDLNGRSNLSKGLNVETMIRY